MKNICMIFAMLCMMAACATLTPEEKAAREAAAKEYIKKALVSQKYKINLTSIRPMRGVERTLAGPWIRVDSTTVECEMPYAGLDDIPHPKTRSERRMESRLEFKSPMSDYVTTIHPGDEDAIVTFNAEDHGFKCKFTIVIGNTGEAKVHYEPEGRDFIDYEGYVVIQKK